MNLKRIIAVAVLVAVVPDLVGIFVALIAGALGSAGGEGLTFVRVWTIRVLLCLVFVWLGRVQRRGLVAHASIAVGLGWVLACAVQFALLRLAAWIATRSEMPVDEAAFEWAIPWWSLLYLSVIAAVGASGGTALRRSAERRGAGA